MSMIEIYKTDLEWNEHKRNIILTSTRAGIKISDAGIEILTVIIVELYPKVLNSTQGHSRRATHVTANRPHVHQGKPR